MNTKRKIVIFSSVLIAIAGYVIFFWMLDSAESQTIAIKHVNFTVSPDAFQVNWGFQAGELWIQNTDGTNAIEVSFDGGSNYWKILASTTDTFRNMNRNSFKVRRATGASGNATVNCLVFPKI